MSDLTSDAVILSCVQQGLWSLQVGRPSMTAYNVPLGLRVPKDVSEPRLAAAFAAVIRRWPVLGGHVEVRDKLPRLIPNAEGIAFEIVEQADLAELASVPFDVSQGPLLRGYFVQDPGVLLLVVHHLVFDGVSIGLLLDCFIEAYEGQTFSPCLPSGYLAFNTAEQSRSSPARLSHWREVLKDLPAPLDLPLDRPRNAITSFAGATLSRKFPKDLGSEAGSFAKAHGIFPSTLFLGVWQGLLGRLCAADDVIVGMPMNERSSDQDGLCGLFVNMVPLRTRGLNDGPFETVLNSLQRRLLDDLSKACPFPVLVRELGLSGSDHAPVFQTGFFYQDGVPTPAWKIVDGLHQQGEYELTLEILEQTNGYTLHVKYDPDLFDACSIEAIADRYEMLLQGVISSPEKILSEHDLVSAQEHDLLKSWNETARDYAHDTLPELFISQAIATPDAVAIEAKDGRLSYDELSTKSIELAAQLSARGIGRGDRVGLCLERGTSLLVGLLGILRSGAAYVPLDPDYPLDRLDYMLRDSGAKLVVTDGVVSVPDGHEIFIIGSGISDTRIPIIGIADTGISGTSISDPAYIIYTSGSSGLPKGVSVSHGSLTNFLHSIVEEPGLTASDRLLAVTTVCFDIAGLELFAPLICGGCVLLCTAEIACDGQQLKSEIARLKPSIMQATPSTWTMLFHAGWENDEGLRVLCGGEALAPSLKARFDAIKTPLWNLYGPTETTIWSALTRLDETSPISIGRPLANTQLYVLDQTGKQQPIGVAGELHIGGAGLALGYHGQDDKTAAAFIDHAFGRLYKSGDLARFTGDGRLEYLGRIDGQIKVRGHRVEPGEIERCLEQHGSIRRAAVVAQEGTHGIRLVAWCEKVETATFDATALKSYVGQSLPGYMVPDLICELDELPCTANGKLDRKLLVTLSVTVSPTLSVGVVSPTLSSTTSQTQAAPVQTSVLEAQLLKLFVEVLEVDGLSRDAGFFEAGGNSISAVLLAEMIGVELGRRFTVTELFRYPSVAALATSLSAMTSSSQKETSPPPSAQAARTHREARTTGASAKTSATRATGTGDLAIVGISCRFPGAPDHRAFWSNLRAGHDSARRFTQAELRAASVPEEIINNPNYVPIQRSIEGKEYFDAGFFNIPPRNAALLAPQFRLLLEGSWSALEDAGLTPSSIPETAVFMAAGGSLKSGSLQGGQAGAGPGTSEDYVAWLLGQQGTLATLVSYHLGLKGPSYAVHANCSSSLVGLQLAATALRSGEVEAALVGACTLFPEETIGYMYEAGLNFASDGRCKTFDAKADGMVAGEGAGVVLLKRAEDAVRDGDNIYALIKGIALNNDGADKAGFYAPSGRGQAEVIGKALRQADIDPATIGLMEAHGTGTKLGDPIEVAALSEAWGHYTDNKGYCAIGSVKTNIGHLDTAAGLAGCIKAALSLYHGEIPPTLHFEQANPEIDFEASPFRPATRLEDWSTTDGTPRRAALSAFGIGGTNAHAVLEQAPTPTPTPNQAGPQLIILSARAQDRLLVSAH
ncbi:MAG: amino acid adenylation domain-containing protein, partial [Halopseudomonas sp.]